jgi:hypothetical protein
VLMCRLVYEVQELVVLLYWPPSPFSFASDVVKLSFHALLDG